MSGNNIEMSGMKQCTKCLEWKPLAAYSKKNPKNRKPGIQPRCKVCCAQDTRSWNEANKETARERYLQKRYGISEQEYHARLLSQDNCCLICKKEFKDGPFGPDSPVVDHCHNKGHVRGILCNECNRGLGYFRDNPEALKRAASYLTGKFESD